MPIAFTSRVAYAGVQERLVGMQRAVWEAIRDWSHPHVGPCIEDLARELARKESSICGRIAELREAGAIEDAEMKVGRSGKLVKTYRAIVWQAPASEVAQMSLF